MVSATTLVLPLLAIDAAQAADPAADLTITKTVSVANSGTNIDESQFLPAIADMRGGGSYQFVADGLRIRTTTSTDKSAQYFSRSSGLPASASMDWVQDEGLYQPGMQIVFDADATTGNGNDWNILVGEPTAYGANWWLTPGSSDFAKGLAPAHTGTGGSTWYGTLAAWRAALPAARMGAGGYALGSGASGVNSGTIKSITFDAQRYDFSPYASSIQARPGETVEYLLTVMNKATATATANAVVVTDTLPADLSYVDGTLIDNGNGCSFVGKNLTCNAGSFPAGIKSTIKFKAKVSTNVTSDGIQPSDGHLTDVQTQEVFANLPANGQPQTFTVMCPTGYTPTDGGLLLDAVDQPGFYSEIATSVSKPTVVGDVPAWTVTATNFGEDRGQGKVKVTCLGNTLSTSEGHTHVIDVVGSASGTGTIATTEGSDTVTRTCPTNYSPIAPQFEVTSGLAVVRASIATAGGWKWTVDHEADTTMTFGLSCLGNQTKVANGHTASLEVTTESDTISLAPESRGEAVQKCLPTASRAITGGYEGLHASVLSLGREQRGLSYMFRFYNDDWEASHNAKTQVTCVADRTPRETRYYHVTNTATVHATNDPSDSSSAADIAIVGDAIVPPPAVVIGPNGSFTGSPVRNVKLTFTCTSACTFTVRVIKSDVVVAKATKTFAASPSPRVDVPVPTTGAGKNLTAGNVTVKVTIGSNTITKTVRLN